MILSCSSLKRHDFQPKKYSSVANEEIIHFSEEEHFDPRTPNPPFLSIPEEVSTLEFVRHANHLKRVEHILEDVANEPDAVVGVDAEWSPYVYKPK